MRCLVTGSEGLIGKELVNILETLGHEVIGWDIKKGYDLSHKANVEYLFKLHGPFDHVYHLMGVKGSPQMTKTRPVDFMIPMLQCDTNMIEAAQKHGVKRFLYTSSIALLNKKTDKYPAWAKETGETLIQAMREQYPKGTEYCIIRPSSVYGKHEDWQREGLMFVSKMVRQAVIEKKDLELWDDGESIRDIVNSKDVAMDMKLLMEEKHLPKRWVGSGGHEMRLRDIAKIIAKEAGVKLKINKKVQGKDHRTMKNKYAEAFILPKEGIKEVVRHVKRNHTKQE